MVSTANPPARAWYKKKKKKRRKLCHTAAYLEKKVVPPSACENEVKYLEELQRPIFSLLSRSVVSSRSVSTFWLPKKYSGMSLRFEPYQLLVVSLYPWWRYDILPVYHYYSGSKRRSVDDRNNGSIRRCGCLRVTGTVNRAGWCCCTDK